MTTRRHSSSPQAGFTLTETLVAVALLAMVALAAIPLLRGAVSAHARVTETAREAEAHAALERTLRTALAAAVQPAAGAGFEGDAARLSLLTWPEGAPGLIQVTLTQDAEGVLIESFPLAGGPGRQEVLTGTPDFVGFHYYGAPDGEPLGWRRDWTGSNLPRLVVLDLQPGLNGAPLRIEAAVGSRTTLACDYDSGLQACREGI